MNRFKGFDLVNRVPEELLMEASNIVQETANKTIPKGKKTRMHSGYLRRLSSTTLKPLTVSHNKPWKALKEMGIPDHLTCLLRNLYVGQEATIKTGHGRTDWFKTGKRVQQGCISSPCLFNLYAEHII